MKSYFSNGHKTNKFSLPTNMHIWRLIKVNYKRSLKFIVVSANVVVNQNENFYRSATTMKYKLKIPNSMLALHVFLVLNVSTV